MICWLLFHSQTKMCSLTEWLCEFRMSGWLSVDGEATWCGHKLLYIWNYNEHQLKNSYLFAHIVCVKYMHTCLCKLTYDTCVMFISLPQKWGSRYKSHLAGLVTSACKCECLQKYWFFFFFSGIWHVFCVNWVKERMRNCVARRLEFSDSETQLGKFC